MSSNSVGWLDLARSQLSRDGDIVQVGEPGQSTIPCVCWLRPNGNLAPRTTLWSGCDRHLVCRGKAISRFTCRNEKGARLRQGGLRHFVVTVAGPRHTICAGNRFRCRRSAKDPPGQVLPIPDRPSSARPSVYKPQRRYGAGITLRRHRRGKSPSAIAHPMGIVMPRNRASLKGAGPRCEGDRPCTRGPLSARRHVRKAAKPGCESPDNDDAATWRSTLGGSIRWHAR